MSGEERGRKGVAWSWNIGHHTLLLIVRCSTRINGRNAHMFLKCISYNVKLLKYYISTNFIHSYTVPRRFWSSIQRSFEGTVTPLAAISDNDQNYYEGASNILYGSIYSYSLLYLLLFSIDRQAGEIIRLVASVRPSVRLSVRPFVIECSSEGAFKMVGHSKWLLFRQVASSRSITLLIL